MKARASNNFVSPFGQNFTLKNQEKIKIQTNLQGNVRKRSHDVSTQQKNTKIIQTIKNATLNYKSLSNIRQKNKTPNYQPRPFNKKSSSQSMKQKCNQKQPKFIINRQNVNFVPIDLHRVSRYNRSMSQQKRQSISKQTINKERWDKCLEQYMKARTRMQNYLRQVKKASYEFDSLQLDKKNIILKRRKILSLKGISSREKNQQKQKNSKYFVSNLIQNQKQIKNQMIKTITKDGDVHRCDALLVNFVSTYFRRKFYKKNRKFYTQRRHQTEVSQSGGMVGLQGKVINQQVINQFLGLQQLSSEKELTSRKQDTNRINKTFRSLNPK